MYEKLKLLSFFLNLTCQRKGLQCALAVPCNKETLLLVNTDITDTIQTMLWERLHQKLVFSNLLNSYKDLKLQFFKAYFVSEYSHSPTYEHSIYEHSYIRTSQFVSSHSLICKIFIHNNVL